MKLRFERVSKSRFELPVTKKKASIFTSMTVLDSGAIDVVYSTATIVLCHTADRTITTVERII